MTTMNNYFQPGQSSSRKALAEFKKNNPDADPSEIKVDIPKAPPAGPAGPGGIHYHVVQPKCE
jgi:hypothetical protein